MDKEKKRRSALKLAAIFVWISTAAAPAFGLISSENSTDIGQIIGANTFYNNGYTGGGAIVANIEAGLVWDGHATLTNATTQLYDSSIASGQPQFDMHATWVGSAIAGEGSTTEQRGIAYGATLWTGAIATGWNLPTGGATYSTSFGISTASFTTPYFDALIAGVSGKTADVINSSYTASNGQSGFIPGGATQYQFSVAIDSLINKSGKLVVFSVGNQGSTTNTIGFPASGTNTFDVGGLTSDTSSPPYGTIAGFSSRSPSDFFVPTNTSGSAGTTLTGVRARVDITAPGTFLTLAHYGGATGGNSFNGPTDSSTTSFDTSFESAPLSGTSFAAPIVAGSAALVADVGKVLFSSDTHATDGRVLKAVLMNSADKPAGIWSNGQSLVSGVVTTTQSLDYTYGSGILDLTNAYTQYTSGTHDISSLTGGSVQSTGWAYGRIGHTSGTTKNDYTITATLKAGTIMNTTLDWYSDETTDSNGLNAAYGSFDNLDLRVYLLGGTSPKLVGQSDSTYNSAEELSFALPTTGSYMIEVLETSYLWNFNGDTATNYGLAWSTGAVPEPAVASVIIFGSMTMLVRRRRGAAIGSRLAAAY